MNKSNSKSEYPSPFVFGIARFIALFISKLCWRVKFTGKENIPQKMQGGLLIASNHQTYLDPFWICIPVKKRLRFMAWDEAFDWFLMGSLIRYLGAFPVNLSFGSAQSFRKALKVLREGAALVVFPEAAREFSDGKLLPFKSGAVKIAVYSGVPILPVTVRGGNRIWARDMKFPRFGKVEIIYHPLLETQKPDEGLEEEQHISVLNQNLVRIIESGLN